MRHTSSLLVATLVACTEPPPPPPALAVTSPERAMVQSDGGQVIVKGTAMPGADGQGVAWVTVNGQPATLTADGSFTATVDVPTGAMLLETTAMSQSGGKITDVRAVQAGQLRPVGTSIDRAVSAALSADAFTKLSAAAGPILKSTDFGALLAPLQPMANLGDGIANVKLSITKLTIGDVKITLTPVDGGLQFSAEIDALAVSARADYSGTLVIDGTTNLDVSATSVTISGTLAVTPAGTAGFTTKLATPKVSMVGLQLHANDLIGDVLDLVQSQLASTVQDVVTSSLESGLAPLVNDAMGALAGPKQLDVLGKKVDLQATPSAITFSSAGAIVTMNLSAKIEGSESSPGYVFTPNGTPTLDVTSGVQLAVADDLLNEMLAEIHALGLLDIHLPVDAGVFDTLDLKLTLPPMISAATDDGKMRLVLGDMVATVSNQGKPLASVAVNAQVDLAITRGNDAQQLQIELGKVELFVGLLDSSGADTGDVASAASAGIGLQLDSLGKFLVTLPLPSIAGVSLDNLSVRGDSGYVVVAGDVH
jgi:hypothetical protein